MPRFTRDIEAGAFSTDVAPKLGITEQTIYRWNQRFSGLEVADARGPRRLEDENGPKGGVDAWWGKMTERWRSRWEERGGQGPGPP